MGAFATEQLNTVLLATPESMLRAVTFEDGSAGGTWDLSYVPFVVEDLVAHSAARVAVQAGSIAHRGIEHLPPVLRDRLVVVDQQGEASERAHAVLAPVFQELGLGREGSAYTHRGTADNREVIALLKLVFALERFLIGVRHRVQIEGDPADLVETAEQLRVLLRNADSRGALASVEGIFRTYSLIDTPSIRFQSSATVDVAEMFGRFVDDETYRQLARDAGLLGVPLRATHAVAKMRRSVAGLLTRPRVRDTMSAGTELVSVATGASVPELNTVARIIGKPRYLPPLISMTAVDERAQAAWEAAAPPFRTLPGVPAVRDSRPTRDDPQFGALD